MARPPVSKSSGADRVSRVSPKPRASEPDPASDAALATHPSDAPDIPVPIAIAEGKALLRLVTKHAKPLSKFGITAAKITGFANLVRRLPVLEKAWQAQRIALHASGATRKQVAEAEALKKKLLGAGRYAYRKDGDALGILANIAEGTGLADTVQDLADLHDFWTARAEGLAITRATQADVDRAAVLAGVLDEAAVSEAADTDTSEAHQLRNQCFWASSELADDLRAAGRYAFEDDHALAAKYTSRYRARIARRARAKKDKNKNKPAPVATPAAK